MRESRHLLHPVLAVLRGRRGTIASTLAVSATTLVGMVALAAEGGVWQLQQRNTRTAADLAALAGATAIDVGTNVVAAATGTANRNGFTNGGDGGRTGVTVSRPPTTGNYVGNNNAVEVVVQQTQNLGLARLVIGTPPTARSRAVALNSLDVNACVLALGGGLSLGGNSTTNAQRCALAANSTQYGINVFGSARVRASDLATTGACTGCDGSDVWTDDTRTTKPAVTPNRPYEVTDPYKPLRNWTPTPPGGCASTSFTNRFLTLSPGQAICSDLTVGTNDTLRLNPGIYYFNNASLDIRGTVTSIGTGGVTLVFTGDAATVGTIKINAQSTTTLTAPTTSLIPGYTAEGRGMLIYRDARATNNGPQNESHLNGGATMRLFGAIYMPTSDVMVNGNSGQNYSTCMPLVAYSFSFSGTANTTVDVSGCANSNIATPALRVARLVE